MLKMSYSFLYNSRICSRSTIFAMFTKLNEISTSPIMELNQLSSKENLQVSEMAQNTENTNNLRTKSNIIAAAFASLSDKNIVDVSEISTPHTDQKIADATTVEQLLSVCNGEGISRRISLKIVSILADWTATKKVKLSEFENDFRFIKLCKVLTKRTGKQERYIPSRSEDLSTVLSITADDEAAKLIETITLTQMIKVMTTLASKKRRSTLLLRTLAYNISGSPEKLNLKLCADLLYSMCTLNFVDENLLSRVDLDICAELQLEPEVKKSAVIGSIITSLGLLKYKSPVLLDLLTNWVAKNYEMCRSQDVFGLFITLATLNYLPDNARKCFSVFGAMLTELEAGKPLSWLDHIWAKVLLNVATHEEVSQILSNNFLSLLFENTSGTTLSTKLKILNINGAAECLLEDYNGNKLKDFPLEKVIVPRRKEKIEMAESIISSLKNLMQAEKYFKTNVDTGYGFLIDAECILDNKCTPKELNIDKPEGIRIAIISLDYHDMTRGRVEPTGINHFGRRLLEAKGYKVLNVPYNEFLAKDKLVTRVQYLERNLKELVKDV